MQKLRKRIAKLKYSYYAPGPGMLTFCLLIIPCLYPLLNLLPLLTSNLAVI